MCLLFPPSRSTEWLDQVNPPPPLEGTGRPPLLNPKSRKFGKLLDPLPRFPSWKRSEEGWQIFLRPRYALLDWGGRRLRLSSGINFHLGKLCWPSPARENPFSTESPDFHPSKNSIINFFEYFSPRLSQISFFDGNREIRAEVYSLWYTIFRWLEKVLNLHENKVIFLNKIFEYNSNISNNQSILFFNILNHHFSQQSLLQRKGNKRKEKELIKIYANGEIAFEIAFCLLPFSERREGRCVKKGDRMKGENKIWCPSGEMRGEKGWLSFFPFIPCFLYVYIHQRKV